MKLVQTMGEKMGYIGNAGLFHGSQDGWFCSQRHKAGAYTGCITGTFL